jgi:hypothetical protein
MLVVFIATSVMDILKPDLMWIEGRCYRLNIKDSSFRGEEDEQFPNDGFAEEGMLSTEIKKNCHNTLSACLRLS